MSRCLLALLACAALPAAERFVAPTGSDSTGTGTFANPYATLAKAHAVAAPGDVITLRGGTYFYSASAGQAHVVLDKVATAAAPTTIRSHPGETAILDGSQTPASSGPSDFGGGSDLFFLGGGRHYLLERLVIQKATRQAFNAWGGSARFLTIRGCTIRQCYRGAVYFATASAYVQQTTFVEDALLEDCDLYENARCNAAFAFNHSGGWPSIADLTGRRNRIVDSRVFRNWGEGIGAYGVAPAVIGCTLWDNYSVEIYLNNATDGVVRGNFITTTDDPAFHRQLGGTAMAANGIQLANEGATDLQCDRLLVANNLVVGPRRTAFYWWQYHSGVGLKNTTIAHNTFINTAGNGAVLRFDGSAAHVDTRFCANVLVYAPGTNGATWNLCPDWSLTASGIAFSHNAWWGDAYANVDAAARSASDVVLAAGAAATPFLAHTGTAAADFRPTAGSRLIDAGTTVAGVATDFAGTARPQGAASDLGAWEVVAGNRAPTIGAPAGAAPSPLVLP